MAEKISTISLSIVFLALLSFGHCCYGHDLLREGAYQDSCPNVENTVRRIVKEKFNKDPTLAPAMIRLYFHDCFSNGCDASLLLDGFQSEKNATANLSVRGYELIDDVKAELEKECEGVVSCADIIALATRDLVTLASGWTKNVYEIPTGRYDSKVSLKASVVLPAPQFTVTLTAALFATRGLDVTDMVILFGGHTIGVTHCSLIMDRLYNYQFTQKSDPSMDPTLVEELKLKCPEISSTDGPVDLDQDYSPSSDILDESFYKQISSRRGVLQLDHDLAFDALTSKTVSDLANGDDFLVKFGQAMVKLGAVGVKGKSPTTEIRTSCRFCKTPQFCIIG